MNQAKMAVLKCGVNLKLTFSFFIDMYLHTFLSLLLLLFYYYNHYYCFFATFNFDKADPKKKDT